MISHWITTMMMMIIMLLAGLSSWFSAGSTAAQLDPDGIQHNLGDLFRANKFFELGWPQIHRIISNKQFKTSGKELNLIILVLNEPNEIHIRNRIKDVFQQAIGLFAHTVASHNLVNGDSRQFSFALTKPSDGLLNYLKQHGGNRAETTIQKWKQDRKPFMVVKISNRGEPSAVRIMDNYDHAQPYLFLFWLDKITGIPVVRYADIQAHLTISLVNVSILLACLLSLILSIRKKSFPLAQTATIPVILFPSGYVWNQLHAEQRFGANVYRFLGLIPIQHGSQQFLAESFLIMFLYFSFSFCLFHYSLHNEMDLYLKLRERKRNTILFDCRNGFETSIKMFITSWTGKSNTHAHSHAYNTSYNNRDSWASKNDKYFRMFWKGVYLLSAYLAFYTVNFIFRLKN